MTIYDAASTIQQSLPSPPMMRRAMFSCPALSAGPYTGPRPGFSLSVVCGNRTDESGGISMTTQLSLC
jgi:hypothetical protein